MKRLGQMMDSVRRAIGLGGVSNAVAVAGAVLVSRGAWAIYAPAGLIVAGLFLIGLAWLLTRAD